MSIAFIVREVEEQDSEDLTLNHSLGRLVTRKGRKFKMNRYIQPFPVDVHTLFHYAFHPFPVIDSSPRRHDGISTVESAIPVFEVT